LPIRPGWSFIASNDSLASSVAAVSSNA
jgi:hypothetical protein